MTKWEYKFVRAGIKNDKVYSVDFEQPKRQEALSDLVASVGQEGWRLAKTTTLLNEINQMLLVFERQVV